MQPTVSIILPNYNYARYLRYRFDTLLQQTYQDFEIILLDDCSTDNSREVLEELATHPKVRCLEVNERNSGSPFEQWKKGISLAHGKYIWIAEADDETDPRFLERCVSCLDRYPQAGIAFTASQLIDEEGNVTAKDFDYWKKRPHLKIGEATLYNGREFVTHNMYWRNCIYNASGVVFCKDAVNATALSALAMRYCADWLFWSEIALHYDVIEIHERLNRFRIHTGSVTRLADYAGRIEDLDILRIFHDKLDIPVCKRIVRCGMFYKRIDRFGLPKTQQKDLHRRIKEAFGYGGSARYTADLAKICPLMPREFRDNTRGKAI